MTATYDDPVGRLEQTLYDYPLTTSALQYWDYPLRAGTTVKQICDLLLYYGRDRPVSLVKEVMHIYGRICNTDIQELWNRGR
ncbi:hypothetical protein LCER1_G004564 [Lachnellula cervina]|uniref:DUF7770 domain-containing protein n=1 Tax=Lachnellula cervina TaxID=1316786 RepID=A0A7D8Z1W3_9HELO|nr:hypothetical protein LCER1_G004564 [Lachnellula cervina]